MSFLVNNLIRELALVHDLDLFSTRFDREKFSKDFYEYSPILRKQLEHCLADVVVRPRSVSSLISVVSACSKYRIPITLRASGTGNYGQCVPLKGGVVVLMGRLNKFKSYDSLTGEITVESGCLLRDLESQLLERGRQLRLLPSTWRSASIGGFLAGGSGGIGSVRWGFLRDPGHLLGLEIITVEDQPRKLELNIGEAEALNHAYGTNGIITSVRLATTTALPWQEVAIDCDSWDDAVNLLLSCSRAAIDLFLCSLLERDIVSNLPSWSGESYDQHRLLLLVSPDGMATVQHLAFMAGAKFVHLGPEDNTRGRGIRELTWNHTTLHMRSISTDWTYLQMLLPQPEISFMQILKDRWKADLLWHIEGVRQNGSQRLAALPLVKWRGKGQLEKLMNECVELGAIMFNPHVITVEDGGLGVVDSDQVEAKKSYDPNGLLNPGKLMGWKSNSL